MKGALAVLLLGGCAAFAGPPFVTDDPEPVEEGHHEFYISSQFTHGPDGTVAQLPLIEVNYGAFKDTQLHLIAPMAYLNPSEGPQRYEYGDTEIGVKYRFIHESEYVPQVGTFVITELPTGNKNRGTGNGEMQVLLPIWLQKSWGKWTTYGGGGWWYNPGVDHRNFWHGGWEIQRDLSPKLTLGAEIYSNSSSAVDTPAVAGYNLGGYINTSEHLHVLFSAGHTLDKNNQTAAYFGLMWN